MNVSAHPPARLRPAPRASSLTLGSPTVGRTVLWALAAAAVLAVGCTSSGLPGGASSDLLASDPPLAQVGLSDVAAASSSCEGLLPRVTDFALLGETGLVVGLDDAGGAVCIHTVEGVNPELRP